MSTRPVFLGSLLLVVLGTFVALAGCGPYTGVTASGTATALPFSAGTVYVSDATKNAVAIFPASPGPGALPAQAISGSSTQLNAPQAMTFDGNHALYVANAPSSGTPSVLVFQVGAFGNIAPLQAISGSNTQLGTLGGIAVDTSLNIYVSTVTNGVSEILVFAAGATGNVSPIRVVTGAATTLATPKGLTFDSLGDLYVANSGGKSVLVFSPGASGNAAPRTVISGSATGFSAPSSLILDASGNLYVADAGANAIDVFSANVSGNAAPARTVSGSNTLLNGPRSIALDSVGNLYVANLTAVDIFPALSSGNVAPSAVGTASISNPTAVQISL